MNSQGSLIFDFDGTLADSFPLAVLWLGELAEEFDFRRVEQNELQELKNLSSLQLVKFLEIPLRKLPLVIKRAREYMHREINTLQGFDGLPEVLQTLYEANITLGILSSNSASNVNAWLARYNIQNMFTWIHSGSSYFGKTSGLKKMIKQHHLDASKTFYVGDETRDVEAAKKCRTKSIAVLWGLNSEATLTAEQPDFIARTPADILEIVLSDAAGFNNPGR